MSHFLAVACTALAVLAGCSSIQAPSHPRPPLPCPGAVATPAAVDVPRLTKIEDRGHGRSTGELVGHGETVRFDLRRTASATAPAPLVLLVPILAGGENLMDEVAIRMLERGYDVAMCARVGSALKPPQRGPELEDLFHRTVLHQRLLLAWLRHDGAHPPATFVLGISLGGMVATALTAVDPELTATTICLSGGDLAELVLHSSEGRVQAWRRWRQHEDGVGDDHLRWEFDQFLQHEPLRTARAVATEKVLYVSGSLDSVVPTRNQDLLWEALGRPTRFWVPFGHYSAGLAISPILDAAAAHFRERQERHVPAVRAAIAATTTADRLSGR